MMTDFEMHKLTPTTLSLQTPLSDLHRRFYPIESESERGEMGTDARATGGLHGTIATIGPVEMPSFTFA